MNGNRLDVTVGQSVTGGAAPVDEFTILGYTMVDQIAMAQVRLGEDDYDEIPIPEAIQRLSLIACEAGGLDPHASLASALLDAETNAWLDERERHVLDVRDGRPRYPGCDKRYLCTHKRAVRARRKAEELGVTVSTINRWIAAYGAHHDRMALLHGNTKTPQSVLDEIDPAVLALLREHVDREKNASKKDLRTEHAMFLHTLRVHGLARDPNSAASTWQEDLPEAWTLMNEARFKKALRALRRNAPHSQDAATRHSQAKRPSGAPVKHRGFDFGEVIEIDAWKIDIEVAGATKPRRLYLVAGQCVFTKWTWLRGTAGTPRGLDMGLLLHDIINPQPWSDVPAPYRSIPVTPDRIRVNAWPPHLGDIPPAVVPGILIADHGPEEENEHFISLCAQLGIQIEWARSISPTDKAHIESYFRTLAKRAQSIPGHLGNAVKNRGETIKGRDILTPQSLAHILRAFPFWYGSQPHDGLIHPVYPERRLTPSEAVFHSLTNGVPLRVAANPNIAMQFLPHKPLTPATYGVELKGQVYCAETREEYELVLSASYGAGRDGKAAKVRFHFDPQDPRRIFFNRPGTFHWHTLYAPGGNGAVARPLVDYAEADLVDVAGHPRPTTRTATEAASAWIRFAHDNSVTVPADNSRSKQGRRSLRAREDSRGFDPDDFDAFDSLDAISAHPLLGASDE